MPDSDLVVAIVVYCGSGAFLWGSVVNCGVFVVALVCGMSQNGASLPLFNFFATSCFSSFSNVWLYGFVVSFRKRLTENYQIPA